MKIAAPGPSSCFTGHVSLVVCRRGFLSLAALSPDVHVLRLRARLGLSREEEAADSEGQDDAGGQDEEDDGQAEGAGGGDGGGTGLVALLPGGEEGALGGEEVEVGEEGEAAGECGEEGDDGPSGAGGAVQAGVKGAGHSRVIVRGV